jgi:hypothetical protein
MMPCNYKSSTGDTKDFDLDNVIDFVGGKSQIQKDWQALIIYLPSKRIFVELRDSPQDVKGNSIDEAEEVSEKYITEYFDITSAQIMKFKENPNQWVFIDQRTKP